MWTCTLLFCYLTDMLKTPPCQRWAWHVQPGIISAIGIGPFIQGRDEHSKCCKTQAAVVITLNEFSHLGGRMCAVVGGTGIVKPMVSSKANWRLSDRLTPVSRMEGAGADLLACLTWQLMELMESAGAWLELIGPDVAKYELESPRMYSSIHKRSWKGSVLCLRYFLIIYKPKWTPCNNICGVKGHPLIKGKSVLLLSVYCIFILFIFHSNSSGSPVTSISRTNVFNDVQFETTD